MDEVKRRMNEGNVGGKRKKQHQTSDNDDVIDEQHDLESLQRKIRFDLILGIIVGHVRGEDEWLKSVELEPGVSINLLKPDISTLTLRDSPFGFRSQSLVDPNVRDCREMSLANCDRRLRALAQRIVGDPSTLVEPYKLVVYEEGGHFQQHTDTSQPGLVKSLVIHLPTECVGGNLLFGAWDPQKYYEKDRLNYILFEINHPHRVERVESGQKISLLFKVFSAAALAPCDVRTVPFTDTYSGTIYNIPPKYENVLFIYPNIETLEKMFPPDTYLKVHFGKEQIEVGDAVYDSVNEIDERYEGSEVREFEDITQNSDEYKVEYVCDLGKPTEDIREYTRYYGCTGNSPCTVEYDEEVKFFTGILVNPKMECDRLSD